MKVFKSIIVTFLFLITVQLFAQTPQQLVKASFDNYKKAILTDNAKAALAEVDSRTKKYYQELLVKTKMLDSVGVNKLPVVDKFTVLVIRHKLSKEEILRMQGTDLFLYAIESGMVGKSSVSDNSIGNVTIAGDFAKGQLVSKGKAVPFFIHFYKEDSKWRFNLTSLFPLANMSFKKLVEDSGKTQNEFLFYMMELMTGAKPEASVWRPVQ
ncbi:hypothetical protein [Desertivirga brevis]|uniref:hypothetical protein n=1 Tax=Desertivirga brevis TaxID=2810310 RepID=UPI001A976EF6|nr:hypothetical protein [Pedobacter sp. SYSU D00873]